MFVIFHNQLFLRNHKISEKSTKKEKIFTKYNQRKEIQMTNNIGKGAQLHE